MEELEKIAFEIISNVGMAKSSAIDALREVRKGNYDDGEKLLKEANEYLVNGHHAHASLIEKEASGGKVQFSLIIMHAEDQMMSAETIKDLVRELIDMYKELKK